jgi:hypothetical protein
MRRPGTRFVLAATELGDDLEPRRLDHQRSVAAANPRPLAYSGAERPLAFQLRTRSAHFDSVEVMTGSVRSHAVARKDRVCAGDTTARLISRAVTCHRLASRPPAWVILLRADGEHVRVPLE